VIDGGFTGMVFWASEQRGDPMNSDQPNPPSIDQQPIRPEQALPHDRMDTAAAPDGLTVLLCQGDHTASKRYIRAGEGWDKIDFDLGFKFRPAPYALNNLAELADLIEEIRHWHHAVVVRGELTPDALAAIERDREFTIARRKNDRGDGVPASLVETARRWVMVDVDTYPLPADADLTASSAAPSYRAHRADRVGAESRSKAILVASA
jgi:hypothetical protein